MLNNTNADIFTDIHSGPRGMVELVETWDTFQNIDERTLDLDGDELSPLLSLPEAAGELKSDWRYRLWDSLGLCEKCGEDCTGVCDIPF